jgi:RNA polymerase sigma-70 factor (ECF subfamily)
MTDQQIIAKTIAGDVDAYGDLVDSYQGQILRYLTGILLNSHAAEDVAQEAFIKAYVNLKSFKTEKKFSSWLFRIAHNEAISYIRKHRREVASSDDAAYNQISDSRKSALEILDEKIDAQLMRDSVKRLESKYREPLILAAFEDKSYEEISDILRIPIGTVGARISRAKGLLKVILTSKGNGHG